MLLKRPTMNNTLIGVFLRFGIFKFALVKNIKKIYYQCFVNISYKILCGFCGFLMILRLIKLIIVE